MGIIKLEASLASNGNKVFRLQTRIFHILHRRFLVKDIPIIINNYNRLEYLQQQVEWLMQSGHFNIHIIDNASTYPPLINFYKKTKLRVYVLDRNVGHEAFWRTHLFQRFGRYYHVLTDPDVLPDDNTPNDFLAYFYELLQQYPLMKKVGFGMRTDDLPDYYPKKQEVINWENKMYADEIEPAVYKSKIDTTFALYRPGAFLQCWDDTFRTGAPYLLRHMPWYENPTAMNEESIYYLDHAGISSSWYKSLRGEDKRYDS